MQIKNLTIDSLRGVQGLSLHDFQDMNLLLGGNDAGKTTVLEAINLGAVSKDFDQIVRCASERFFLDGYSQFDAFLNLFPFSEEPERTIAIHMDTRRKDGRKGKAWQLKLHGQVVTMQKEPTANASETSAPLGEINVFSGIHCVNNEEHPLEVSEDFKYKITSRSRKSGSAKLLPTFSHFIFNRSMIEAYRSKEQEEKTVRLLQIIDKDIVGLKLQTSKSIIPSQVVEHRKYGEVPLFTYGDGMKKILTLAGAVAEVENGVLLIDEIETSLQVSLLSDIFSWLIKACRLSNVQLFATTHSIEAISALADCAAQDEESSLACYRIERRGNATRAVRFSKESLNELVNGSGIDVR